MRLLHWILLGLVLVYALSSCADCHKEYVMPDGVRCRFAWSSWTEFTGCDDHATRIRPQNVRELDVCK